MPLFLDFHKISDLKIGELTIDDIKEGHSADLAVQDKYNVKYHQFWVNQKAGSVFCLIEGPDKENCVAVHREAHGDVACNIVKVERETLKLFMGENPQLDHGLVRGKDGTVDPGYRFVLVVDIRGNAGIMSPKDYKPLRLPEEARKAVHKHVSRNGGKMVHLEQLDYMTAVFDHATDSARCAIEIYKELAEKSREYEKPDWDLNFKMGLSGGQPLTEKTGFFERILNMVQRLIFIAEDREIIASNLVEKMNRNRNADERIRFISTTDEQFLLKLFDAVENNISDSSFSVSKLSRYAGVSRSQLYRKLKSIAGCPPNRFIRNIRMQKALHLIMEEQYNISEVSLMVGYNSPSYFSKCFHQKYGVTPSKLIS